MRALGDVAERYSRGFGHVTTRQNMQFHFVKLQDAETAMRELARRGSRRGRPAATRCATSPACPYAGVAGDEVFDVTPYAEAMTRYFLGHPAGRIAAAQVQDRVRGLPEDHALASINDIGWRADLVGRPARIPRHGRWRHVDSADVGGVLYEFLPVEEMLDVAEAIVRVFHRFGDYQHRQRNRMKFLIREIGWDAWRAKYDEALAEFARRAVCRSRSAATGAESKRRPTGSAGARAPIATWPRTADSRAHGPGIVPGSVKLQTLSDAYLRWMHSNVGLQRQAGYVHVTVRLPLGDITAGSDARPGRSRRGVQRRNGAPHHRSERPAALGEGRLVQELYERLQAAGLGAADAGTVADVVSCPGAESCRLAVTQSRGLGRILTEYLTRTRSSWICSSIGDIKISGCPNGCGQHHIAAIGFQGSVRKVAAIARAAVLRARRRRRADRGGRISARWSRRCRCTG
jgi:sulfite reductase beta subunit-like hemoprotein